ncbi:MAG: hypothetical protein PHU25_07285 [Deltaproteobacteria bacterium]|nr:hypothetical protein [Deltaproteobacteria bacterium]
MTRITMNKGFSALFLAAAIAAIVAVSCSPDKAGPECEGDGSASGCAQGSYCGLDNKCITDCATNAECQANPDFGLLGICDTNLGKCVMNEDTGGTDIDADGDSDTTLDAGYDAGDAGDDGGMDTGMDGGK